MTPKIIPTGVLGECWNYDLTDSLTQKQISSRLGFLPNCQDDTSKVRYSWGFTVNGSPCGIWDYKGSRWSVYDPDRVLHLVFPEIENPG